MTPRRILTGTPRRKPVRTTSRKPRRKPTRTTRRKPRRTLTGKPRRTPTGTHSRNPRRKPTATPRRTTTIGLSEETQEDTHWDSQQETQVDTSRMIPKRHKGRSKEENPGGLGTLTEDTLEEKTYRRTPYCIYIITENETNSIQTKRFAKRSARICKHFLN